MTAGSRDAEVVADLQEFAAVAAAVVRRGREAYLADTDDGLVLRYAGRAVVLNVSSAADRLSEGFRAARPDVPWRAVRDTRNRIAHDYAGVNDVVVWTALAVDIPRLLEQVVGPG